MGHQPRTPQSRRRSIARARAVLIAGAAALLAGQGVALASPGGPGAQPPQPTISEYSTQMARPLTAAELARGAAKEAEAQAHWRDVQKKRQGATPYATANDLGVGYQGQINYYYCGPATTAMIAGSIGDGWGGTATQQQNAAANLLATTASGGTAWYGSDNVPNYPYGSWYRSRTP